MNKKTIFLLCSVAQLAAAAIWGFAFVVVKDSLDYIGPIWMVAFRFTIAAVVLGLIYIKKLVHINRKTLANGAVLGLFLGLAYIFQTIGCDFTTAGKNAFLTTVYVFLVPLFSWPVSKKRPELYVFLCAVMSLVGIGLLALGNNDAGKINIGDVLTLICGIFYALHIVVTAKFNEKEDPLVLTVLQFVFAALLGWLCAPFLDSDFPVQGVMTSRVVISMLYLGILSTLVCFIFQNVGLKYLPSALSALLLSFESVFGTLFGCIILHEAMTVRMFIGCGLIFMAVVISQILPEVKK